MSPSRSNTISLAIGAAIRGVGTFVGCAWDVDLRGAAWYVSSVLGLPYRLMLHAPCWPSMTHSTMKHAVSDRIFCKVFFFMMVK